MKWYVLVLVSLLFLAGFLTLIDEISSDKPLAERDSRRLTAGWILLSISIIISLVLYYWPPKQVIVVTPHALPETTATTPVSQ